MGSRSLPGELTILSTMSPPMMYQYAPENWRFELRPIAERTRVGYLQTFDTARRYSIDKRTTDFEDPALVTLTEMVVDLQTRNDFAESTRANVRSAILWYLDCGHTEPNADVLKARALLKKMEYPRNRKATKRGRRAIPLDDLNQLLGILADKSKRSNWAHRSAAWIRAGLACGARPCEWLDARLINLDGPGVWIRNAKQKCVQPVFLKYRDPDSEMYDWAEGVFFSPAQSEGINFSRRHPSHRLVPLEKPLDRDFVFIHLELIQKFLDQSSNGSEPSVEFEKYHRGCSQAIKRACETLWANRKTYTLQTMRSQFSANMKAAKGPEVTALLMGHSSENSPASSHYGKGNQAHAPFKGSRKSQVTDSLNEKLKQHRCKPMAPRSRDTGM